MGFQGTIAPSRNVLLVSGITRSVSTSNFTPNPSQSGQAPKGALKENKRGSNSPTVNPQ